RLNDLHKGNSRRLRKTAAIAATTLILTMPVNNVLTQLNMPGFEAHYASAASLADVQLLTDVASSAGLTENPGPPYDLKLAMAGTGLADVELLTPERVGVFYAPDLAGKMTADGPANVRVEILPITMDDLPALKNLVGGLTGTVTDLVTGLTSGLDAAINGTLL